MKKITKEVIEDCARTLMFELSPGQSDMILQDFDTVLAQIDFLSRIEGVDSSQPMTFPYSEHQRIMREDVPSKTLKNEEALRNCKTKIGRQVRLPRVVGNDNDKMDA